jgi:putative spermidine/putrescine transport system substrate-binding protein
VASSAAATLLSAPAIGQAQAREIVVGGPGGMAGVMRDLVVPDFERKNNCKVLYEGSRSVVNLQKLQTDKARPKMSVVMMDEDIMLRAGDEGLIAPVSRTQVPLLSEIAPAAVAKDSLWIRYKTPATAVAYNSKALPGGVPTWASLWEPRFKSKLMMPHMSLSSTVVVLAMAAHLETGKPLAEAQYDADAGFRKLRTIKPNILGIHSTGQQAQTLMEQGEAWAIPGEISSYVLLRKSEGVPVDLAQPKEGSFGVPSAVALVKGGPNAELAQAFINALLDLPAQELWASKFFDSPAHPRAKVGPGILSLSQMFNMDWAFVAKNRAAWIERFDREIAA